MRVYYNEIDPKKCAMLAKLMDAGHITKGDIDDRSITDVKPEDLSGYGRCHFFAGIGLWDYALQLAGWGDAPVWTGSCPCQPFSTAGRQKGKADDRHLWPVWQSLITECRPATVFGEQVESAISKGWLDDVYEGLEAQGYAVGAAVLTASSVGAPHQRKRLWFVGYAEYDGSPTIKIGRIGEKAVFDSTQGQGCTVQPTGTSESALLSCIALGDTKGQQGTRRHAEPSQSEQGEFRGACSGINVAYTECQRQQRQGELRQSLCATTHTEQEANRTIDDRAGNWEAGEWVNCPDGKARLVEPSIQLLAHGYSHRVSILHAIGDGIVPQVAAGFIQAAMEA